jgi:hypothetical protein
MHAIAGAGHKRKKYTRALSWPTLAVRATGLDQCTGDADVPSVVNSARYRYTR